MYTSSDPSINNNDPALNNSHLSNDAASRANSAASWGAIFAGATAAAALSLILLLLGTGLGMSSVSPWAQDGISATAFGISTVVWVTFMSIAASALGGYLAGRLRTKWVGVHTDEVYFRDTAHGLLAWAVATLFTAAFLTSVVGAIIGGGVKAGASVAGGLVNTATTVASATAENVADDSEDGTLQYYVDSLFRRGPNQQPVDGGQEAAADTAAEVGRILVNSIVRQEDLPQEDQRYIAQLIAETTGLSQQEAEKRVADTYSRLQTRLTELEEGAKEAADAAREASAYASLWFFVSLLAGAFSAALAATWGGRQRDL